MFDFFDTSNNVDYTKIKKAEEIIRLCGDEGSKWAAAFSQFYKEKYEVEIDHLYALMWFANAIETAKEISYKQGYEKGQEDYVYNPENDR